VQELRMLDDKLAELAVEVPMPQGWGVGA